MRVLISLLAVIMWNQTAAQSVPQARLSISPSTGDRNTVFVLDASQSANARGDRQNLEFQFRPDQRSARSPFSSQSQLSFRASDTGTLTAEVVVRDTQTGATAINALRYVVRENLQREVQIRVSDTNPLEGDTITYEAIVFGNNITRSELKSRWDFNSDGRWDTPLRSTLVATETPLPGRAFPTVEVRFPDGQTLIERGFEINTSTATRNQNQGLNYVTTQRNQLKPPVIEVTPITQIIKENTNVTFDGSKTEILTSSYLEWVIESRTIRDKERIDYVFRTGGPKTVTLRHCLINNPNSCLETQVEVMVETKPNDQYLTLNWQNMSDPGRKRNTGDYALITASDELRLNVRAQGQMTANQSFLYRWDFEGDGEWDTDFQAETSAKHQYLQPGVFVAVVEALPSITTKNFERLTMALPVYVERNRLPYGDFEIQQENNYVGEKVTYTAMAKDPESGNNVTVRFDSDADGVWDSGFRNQRSWWWVYDTPGEYKVRLQIRDPQGRLTEISKVMTILPMPEPEAFVEVSHRIQTKNRGILLDASPSVGRKLEYSWSVLEQPHLNLSGSRTSLRLPVGDYNVQLTIRDRLGAQDSVVFPVSFIPAPNLNSPQPTSTPNSITSSQDFATTNIINNLPGARAANNYIIPPEGAPSIRSPFQIQAGQTAINNADPVRNLRATP